MGEIGWDVDGYVVNRDLTAYQDIIAILYQAGVLPWLENRATSGKPVTVLEIGSGYGGFTYFFSEILPTASYWACDLPESLIVAAMYFSVTRPEPWRGITRNVPVLFRRGYLWAAELPFRGIQRQGAQGRSGRQHDVAVRDVRSADPLLRP